MALREIRDCAEDLLMEDCIMQLKEGEDVAVVFGGHLGVSLLTCHLKGKGPEEESKEMMRSALQPPSLSLTWMYALHRCIMRAGRGQESI